MEFLWKRNNIRRLKNIILTSIILIPITTISLTDAEPIDNPQIVESLPFCDENNQRTINRRLLYVTTLDGKLSALDISKGGQMHWSIPTEPGPLISSSIHRLELTNNGQWVRMIPSLSGGLYKFDGESLDPIPITAENLLSSSFKFSDDLVISGGKETRSYGVSAKTGQILYKCSMHGCWNETDTSEKFGPSKSHDNKGYLSEHDPLLDDVLVVRRQTQTVRAVEPRTGSERWNFSVGHHELEILRSQDCHDRTLSDLDMAVLDLEIKVIVPEGIVCAFHKDTPNIILWKYKFDHPIVSAWRTDRNDNIQNLDLFDSAQWIWNGELETNINQDQTGPISPSIYIGMFQKQLYIQESLLLQKRVLDETKKISQHMVTTEANYPRIPWKPFPATSSALAIIDEDERAIAEIQPKPGDEESSAAFALSVLYASEYVNGNGFFLFSSTDLNKTENALCDTKNTTEKKNNTFEFNFEEEDTPVKVIIISLWFWWKEIGVIALTTAVLLNLLLSPKLRREREVVVIEKHVPVPTALEATEESFSKTRSSQRSVSESYSSTSENFVSRFSAEFELIQCLGKGGFGVVFEAKNKLDDCNYAVKRIVLPRKKESRERMMREVKTLASCEHHNIVRYFHSWVENPPPGWQDAEDQKWIERDILSTSIDIETPDGTTLPSILKDANYNNNILSNRSKKLKSWGMSLDEGSMFKFDDQSKDLPSVGWNPDDSSSFIQFKEDSNDDSSHRTNVINEEPEDSYSFEIAFEHSKNIENSKTTNKIEDSISSITSNTTNFNGSTSNRKQICNFKNQKRPVSLDLTSTGNVKIPISERNQNKVYLYIQMQLCRKQSLKDWMRECSSSLRRPRVNNIFEQIVDAVDYVHFKGLIHRDLKPSNIFFSLDGQIKIGDFGLVTDMAESPSDYTLSADSIKSHTNRLTQQVGTHLYMSPEQLDGRPYDYKVDIFSLGLVFFELLVDFSTEMERIQTLKGLRAGQFPKEFQNNFINEYNLLKCMLAHSPEERPSTSQIKEKLTLLTGHNNDNERLTIK